MRWCSLMVSGVLIAGCGRSSRSAGADGAGGTLGASSGGGGLTASAGSGVAGRAAGGVGADGAGGASSAGTEVGGAGGEPSTLEDGGQGGVAAMGPLDWKLELEIIEPLQKHLAVAQTPVDAFSGLIAVSEDGARVLGSSTFQDPPGSGKRQLGDLMVWTKELGGLSLGSIGDFEPAINTDTGGPRTLYYYRLAFAKAAKTLCGTVMGSAVPHPFVWRDGEGMKELTLPGTPVEAICQLSDDGQVVIVVARYSYPGQQRSFRFDSSGGTDLGTLPGSDSLDTTYVSPDGSFVIGEAFDSECTTVCPRLPVSWQLGGVPQEFDLPPGAHDCFAVRRPEQGSRRFALECALDSQKDRAVWSEGLGWKQVTGGPSARNYVSFLAQDGGAAFGRGYMEDQLWHWDSATGTTVLPVPESWHFYDRSDISDDATMALVQLENKAYRRGTARWTVGKELLVLATPTGSLWSIPRSMSADGSRITTSTDTGDNYILWVDGHSYFIADLFAQSGIDVTGIRFDSAEVSRDGHILSGSARIDGASRGWLTRLP